VAEVGGAMTEVRTAREIADRISWRDPEALISGAVVLIFAIGYIAAYWLDVPRGAEQAIGQLQGAAIAGLSSVISYWLGSSRGSRRSADRADRAVDLAKTAVEK
jgi:hypothetical protein